MCMDSSIPAHTAACLTSGEEQGRWKHYHTDDKAEHGFSHSSEVSDKSQATVLGCRPRPLLLTEGVLDRPVDDVDPPRTGNAAFA